MRPYRTITGVYHNNTDNLAEGIRHFPLNKLEEEQGTYDEVFLLSAYITGGKATNSERQKMYSTNVKLVERVCSRFQKSRIIFSSTIMVYQARHEVINETSLEGYLNEYGISKLWGEKMVENCTNYAIVRPAFVYGIGMKPTPMIPSYIQQALHKNQIEVWGAGHRVQNYLHVKDAVGYLQSAAQNTTNGKFLALGNDSLSNLQIAQLIAGVTNSSITYKGTDNTPSFYFNNSQTTALLTYTPKYNFAGEINNLIEWVQKKF